MTARMLVEHWYGAALTQRAFADNEPVFVERIERRLGLLQNRHDR